MGHHERIAAPVTPEIRLELVEFFRLKRRDQRLELRIDRDLDVLSLRPTHLSLPPHIFTP